MLQKKITSLEHGDGEGGEKPPQVPERSPPAGTGREGAARGLKIHLLLPKGNLAASTLSHSFLCESG